MSRGIERRNFLKGSAATVGLGALGMSEPAWSAPAGTPRIRSQRTLGKTGLRISDISFGSALSTDPALARHAFRRGINYFDTAESYKRGQSEEAIGRALKEHREEVILASKVECHAHTKRGALMTSLEGSLQRLSTDRIDIYFNHAVNSVARLQNDEWYEFTAKAKRQGKIRFTGMSGHSGKLIQCITHAIDNELVDVLLCAYNFGVDPAFYERFISRMDFVTVQHGLPDVLAKARAKGIGVVVMKTLRGARLNDMRPYEKGGATFAQAALRWTLSSPHVDGLIVSMTSVQQIDEYLGASGGSPAAGADFDLLEEYLLSSRDGYCNHGCEQCHSACPNGVAINEVLRTRMYATDYRDLATAREEYAKLGPGASACANCADQPCLGKCPQHLDVAALTTSAHQMLG